MGSHAEKDDFENTCVGKDESMESEVETNLTFLKDITLDESPFENLKEGDCWALLLLPLFHTLSY